MRILTVAMITLLTSSLFLAKAIAHDMIDQQIAEGKMDAVEAVKYDCAGITFYNISKRATAEVDTAGKNNDPSYSCLVKVESNITATLANCRADQNTTESSAREAALQLARDIDTCLNQPASLPTQE